MLIKNLRRWPTVHPLADFSLIVAFLCLMTLLLPALNPYAMGQDVSSLLRAIELVDSNDIQERDACERALQSALKRNLMSPLVTCGLVFASFQAEDAMGVLNWIDSVPKTEKLPKELQIAIAKMELCAAIAVSNHELAETRFQGIVKAAINEKTDLNHRRSYTELAGRIIELLEAASEDSPVKKKTLIRANEILTVTSNRGLAMTYQSAKKESKAKTDGIKEWSEKLGSQSQEQREQTFMELKNDIETLQRKLTESSQLARQATANHKEVNRSKIVGSRKLNADYQIAFSEPPASGHPGAEPRVPIKPNKSSIRVEQYETKLDKNGKEERVRRTEQEMDRERDSIFRRLETEYDTKKREYDRDIASYRVLWKAWQEREQIRQEELSKRLAGIKESLTRLQDEYKQAEMDHKSAGEELRNVREDLDKKRLSLLNALIVETSMKSDNRVSAYCLSCLNAISVRDEKIVLIKAFQSQEKAAK